MSQCLLVSLIEEDPDTREMALNSNEPLFVLIRETDLLSQMALEVPPVAKTALYQQKTLKQHKSTLEGHVDSEITHDEKKQIFLVHSTNLLSCYSNIKPLRYSVLIPFWQTLTILREDPLVCERELLALHVTSLIGSHHRTLQHGVFRSEAEQGY
ncbi:hypothetical protein AVEN_126790-1 [Araneus ventricosus]|uniref:Uncharacterized protein n=1 Tax=Araneus ventricosus TaxID=182803 RepID=A0A4Y2WYA1_ARAVE|nr:hypothetical protein AVEN_126790-1 [Araneus ventricosus]